MRQMNARLESLINYGLPSSRSLECVSRRHEALQLPRLILVLVAGLGLLAMVGGMTIEWRDPKWLSDHPFTTNLLSSLASFCTVTIVAGIGFTVLAELRQRRSRALAMSDLIKRATKLTLAVLQFYDSGEGGSKFEMRLMSRAADLIDEQPSKLGQDFLLKHIPALLDLYRTRAAPLLTEDIREGYSMSKENSLRHLEERIDDLSRSLESMRWLYKEIYGIRSTFQFTMAGGGGPSKFRKYNIESATALAATYRAFSGAARVFGVE